MTHERPCVCPSPDPVYLAPAPPARSVTEVRTAQSDTPLRFDRTGDPANLYKCRNCDGYSVREVRG